MKQLLSIFILFSMISVQAFVLNRVIVSSDTNPIYIELWPIVAKVWKELIGIQPTLILIAPLDFKVDETLGDVIRIEPIPGIKTSEQAQVVRNFAAALFPDDFCIMSDIDLLPLNRAYFTNGVHNAGDSDFVVFRDGVYKGQPMYSNRYPMCFNAAKGKIFAEIFDINSLEDIKNKIKEFNSFGLGWDTDEIMLGTYLHKWPKYATHCIKLGYDGSPNTINSVNGFAYDRNLLKNGYYFFLHSARQYSCHKEKIHTILGEVGLKIAY